MEITSFRTGLPDGQWTGHQRTPAGPGPTSVLALHGFTGSALDFEPIWEACASPYGVLAPDLPGHGGTWLASASVERVVAGLAALADDRLPENHILLGYSLGGRTALHYALCHPKRLRGLVLVGATAGLVEPEERAARVESDRALVEWMEQEGVEAFCERWMATPLIASQGRLPAAILEPMQERRRRNRVEGLAQSLRDMGAGTMPAVWDRLGELKLPVMVVSGEEDVKYREIGERLVHQLPEGRLVVLPGAGHAAHLENLPAFVEALRGFVDGLS